MLSIVLVSRSFQRSLLNPFISSGLHAGPSGLHGVSAKSMIVRDALDNGIRLVTESMATCGRSASACG